MTDATHPTPERLREMLDREVHFGDPEIAAALRRLLALDLAIGDPKDWKREQARYPNGRVDYVSLHWAIVDASREEDAR